MIKVCLLGAGQHCERFHLPALARFAKKHPEEVVLAGLCDLDEQKAETAAKQFGFQKAYTDLEAMLDKEKPDGCIAVTPVSVTFPIAQRILERDCVLAIEKPPGATLEEAKRIVDLVEQKQARVMVSMNRRFMPALKAAVAAVDARPLHFFHAVMSRTGREDPDFFRYTAIHTLDAMRSVAGDIKNYQATKRDVDGIRWDIVDIVFESGLPGRLESLPTAGRVAELYELSGSGFHVAANVFGEEAGTLRRWENGKPLPNEDHSGEEHFICQGAYDETLEFMAAIKDGRAPYPSPAQVLQSVKLCSEIFFDGS